MTKNSQNYNPRLDPQLAGKKGWVYILKNKVNRIKRNGKYITLLKIGATSRTPQNRCDEENRNLKTGSPGRLKVVYKKETCDCGQAEYAVHCELSGFRYTEGKSKEWFAVSQAEAEASISKHCTKYDKKAEEKRKKKEKKVKKFFKKLSRKEAEKKARKKAEKKIEKKAEKRERKREAKEKEERKRNRQRMVFWGVALGVVSFVLWNYWRPIIWTVKLLLFLSLAAVLLYFAWAYLRDNIFTDDIDDDDDIDTPEGIKPPSRVVDY